MSNIIKSGQWVEHKFREPKEYVKVSYVGEGLVRIDGLKDVFWFTDNVQHSRKLIHRLYNWFIS